MISPIIEDVILSGRQAEKNPARTGLGSAPDPLAFPEALQPFRSAPDPSPGWSRAQDDVKFSNNQGKVQDLKCGSTSVLSLVRWHRLREEHGNRIAILWL
jgi:hypothetical protein